ncbi:MAG: O-antigen ligase family protein [Clostridiales bacterium]|nr:O-antigen ligase family protein [Clostridiales bacterium]
MNLASIKSAINDVGLFKKAYLLNALFITFYYSGWYHLSTITTVPICFWALYLFIQAIKNKRYLLREKALWMLVAFMAVLILSILVNLPSGLDKNMMSVAAAALTFFVVYYLGEEDSAKQKKTFEDCLKIILVYSCVMSAISILMYFSNICLVNYKGRFCGVYENAILSGLVANGGLFCTVYFIWGWKRRPLLIKLLCIVQIIVQVIMIFVSNSRSAFLCFITFFVIYIGMKIANLHILKNPNGNRVLKIIVALLTAAAILMGSGLIADGINDSMYELNKTLFTLRYPDFDPDNPNYLDTENWFAPKPFERDFSSGARWALVITGWEVFSENPILGVSPGNLVEVVEDKLTVNGKAPSYLKALQGGRIHNSYLDIMASMGIAGALCMLMFAVYTVIKAYQCTFALRRDYPAYDHNTFVVSLIGAMAVYFFVESTILFTMSFAEAFFWLCLGHLAQRAKALDRGRAACIDK